MPPRGGLAHICHPEVGLLIYATRRWACSYMPPGGGLAHMPPRGGLVHMPPGGGLNLYMPRKSGLPYATRRWACLCHPEVGFIMPPGGGLALCHPEMGFHMPPRGGLPYATRRQASLCHPEVGLFNENLHSSYIHKINPANIMFNLIYSGTLH